MRARSFKFAAMGLMSAAFVQPAPSQASASTDSRLRALSDRCSDDPSLLKWTVKGPGLGDSIENQPYLRLFDAKKHGVRISRILNIVGACSEAIISTVRGIALYGGRVIIESEPPFTLVSSSIRYNMNNGPMIPYTHDKIIGGMQAFMSAGLKSAYYVRGIQMGGTKHVGLWRAGNKYIFAEYEYEDGQKCAVRSLIAETGYKINEFFFKPYMHANMFSLEIRLDTGRDSSSTVSVSVNDSGS